MASEVKTNKVSPATSTTLNVGDSGDTLALAVDSVTGFKVGSDAAGDVLYNDGTDYTRLAKPGTPADEVLTFATGASAPSWAAAAAGGLTAASMWRLTTSFTGAATPIASNLVETSSPVGYGVLGSSMTESSGIFTFPSTGYWLIMFNVLCWWNGATIGQVNGAIGTTTDDSTYVDSSVSYTAFWDVSSTAGFTSHTSHYIFDVTSTSTHKCRFRVGQSGSLTPTTLGYATGAWDVTNMTFLRLADT